MRRDPRDWKANWYNYIGHALQGWAIFHFMDFPFSLILMFVGYLVYQWTEYNRAKDIRRTARNGWQKIGDWISRDISDLLAGGWLGVITNGTAVKVLSMQIMEGLTYLGLR